MRSSPPVWIHRGRSSANGASGSVAFDYPASRLLLEAGVQPVFPPSLVVAVKALARVVAEIGGTTLWRWLSEDALQPWRHRTWIFPRAPAFAAKAGPIRDLYEGRWNG